MLVEQINSLHPKPFERGIGDPLDVLRAAVQTVPAGTEVEPELGGDDHLPAKRFKRFAHKFFIDEGAVHFGGVEEGDPPVNRLVNKSDHLLLVGNRVFIMTHSHTAETEC